MLLLDDKHDTGGVLVIEHCRQHSIECRMIEKRKYEEMKRNSYKLYNKKRLPKSILPLICIADLVAAMSAAASIVMETGV